MASMESFPMGAPCWAKWSRVISSPSSSAASKSE